MWGTARRSSGYDSFIVGGMGGGGRKGRRETRDLKDLISVSSVLVPSIGGRVREVS